MSYLRATLFMFVIHVIFAAIGWAVYGEQGAIIATGIAFVFHVLVLWKADKLVLSMYKAREVDDTHPSPMVRAFVHECREMSLKAGLICPRLFIMDAHQPNAFAVGRDAMSASIAVTNGLLLTLNRQETRSVIAHELAHVKRGDSLSMGIASAVSGLLSRLTWVFVAPFGLYGVTSRFISRVVAIIFTSKSREFAADREGSKISGSPLDLASALEKIERNTVSLLNPLAEKNPSTAHIYVVDPLRASKRTNRSSHPATDKRIARLRQQADAMNAAPEAD
jgi:heat shock protein HtpX